MSEKIYDELKQYLKYRRFISEFHTEVHNLYRTEIDFMALKPTKRKEYTRKYIFELKEKDFDKVVKQADERRVFCDYIYIVLVRMRFPRFTYKLSEYLDELREKGIGVLYFNEDLMKDSNFFEIVHPNWQGRKDENYASKNSVHNKWAEVFDRLDKKLPEGQEKLEQ